MIAGKVLAQPTLPDLAAVSKNGVNILTWNCQYNGLKSIAVKRAKDSLGKYDVVGYVNDLKKGIQVFADGHPMAGNNWYQLEIIFSSNLSWTSNKVKLHVDANTLAKEKVELPPNDNLQKLVSASANTTNKDISRHEEKKDERKGEMVVAVNATQKGVVSSAATNSAPQADPEVKKGPKITISMNNNNTDMNPYLKAEHIYNDEVSGHIKVEVPDVKKHIYTIVFYDNQNTAVLDVPKLYDSPILIDKRNFNKKGIYKFILRRDNAQYETGNVTVY